MKSKNKLSSIILIFTLVVTMCSPMTALGASKKVVKITPAKNISVVMVKDKKSIRPKTNVKVKKITYKVSNKKLATVKSGKLVAKKTGTVKVKITVVPKSNKYKTTSKTVKIKIVKKHSHSWKAVYGTKTVTKPAYDEKVLVKKAWDEQVITNTVAVCNQCEFRTTDADTMTNHQAEYGHSCSFENDYKTVHHDAEYKIVHHNAEITKQKYIKYYKCSKCGATK